MTFGSSCEENLSANVCFHILFVYRRIYVSNAEYDKRIPNKTIIFEETLCAALTRLLDVRRKLKAHENNG